MRFREDMIGPYIIATVFLVVAIAMMCIRDRGRCLHMGPSIQHTYFLGSMQLDSAEYASCDQWERP